MEPELFLVSAIYWIALLAVGIWLNRRLSALKQQLTNLEREEQDHAD
jgi:FtsZ-interacting cell division protein ZipA